MDSNDYDDDENDGNIKSEYFAPTDLNTIPWTDNLPLGPGEASIAKIIFALAAKLAKMEHVLEEFYLQFETFRVERLERA